MPLTRSQPSGSCRLNVRILGSPPGAGRHASWPSAFENFGADIDEIIDKRAYVVVSLVLHGRLKASGQQVTMPETHVWEVSGGKVIEMREYSTSEAALQAVSASDQAL